MTFQPPPPQGPQGSQSPQNMPPQGPPPAGQWGPPPGQPARPGSSFDPKTVNQLDWGILAAGVLAFIFSLFDYYSLSYGPYSASYSAWHGFFGWFAALVALVGAAVVSLELFMPHVKLAFPNRLIGLAAFALATLCVILALFIIPDGNAGNIPGINEGHGFAYWISLIVIIAGLVLSFMRFQQTGGQLPIGGGTGRGFGGAGGSSGHGMGSSGMGGHSVGGHSAPAGPPPSAPAGPPPSAPTGPPPGYAPPAQGSQPPPPGYGAPPPQAPPSEQGQYGQQPPPPPSH